MTEHLVIPFAACAGHAWASAMKTLPADSFQHLGKLLQGMKHVQTHTGDAHSLSPPHERVLAAALGLPDAPDGLIPWAALAAGKAGMPPGKAWAFITPCHWAMGREHATLTDPADLAITAEEAHTLRSAMQPYFETEGITLHPGTPGRWLAEGEVFRTLPTASLDRVLGRNVDAWLPDKTTAGSLRRLQNEMQMLLYTHPLNDTRSANRQRTVNSFWISGSGALSERDTAAVATQQAPTSPRTLAQAVFADDWAAYAAAWAALDAGDIAQLLARQKAGGAVRLTLCGDSHAQTFESVKTSLFSQIKSLFSPMSTFSLLEQL
jgi:hypothetical protein